ncbi:sensor histidine kinase [Oligoflexus tunisiensis]|uniref:sensor histidine kinase n=1 Tax=Oligoflexus tunisiensis TaxID=708132 RepID=UPI00114CD2BE|nr:sensor histidine kinase [Oligoflexus tunisiensis]
MRILFFYILCFFASVFAQAKVPLYAQEALRVPPHSRIDVRYRDQVRLLRDENDRWRSQADQLLTQTWSQPTTHQSLNMGFADGTLWVRFHLVVDAETPPRLVLSMKESSLNWVTLYQVVQGQLQVAARGGSSLPPHERSIHSSGIHLLVENHGPGSYEYILGVQAQGGIQDASFTLQPANLWITQRLTPSLVFQGIFYGLLLALIISNAMTWYLTRQRVYLYYATYVGSLLAVVANFEGVLDWLWPWPSSGGWIHFTPIFSSCVAVSLLLMLKSFYQADIRFPKLARVFNVCIAVNILPGLLNTLDQTRLANQLVNIQTIPGIILVVATGWYVWRKGFRPALSMMVARLVMLTFTSIMLLKLFNVLPSNLFTDYAFHLGIILEMVIVSFGLAQRLKNLESEKNQAEQKERLATVRLDWFNTLVRVITHDMSTPISIIATSADLELRRCKTSGASTHNLERIQRAVQQQNNLVGHVREMIAVTTGKKVLRCVPIELQGILDGLVLNFSEGLETKQLTVQLDQPGEPLYMLGEATALEHTILGNFMSNAIKFSRPGGVIRIQLQRDQEEVVIRFEDNGIGIPPGLIDKLFDPTQATSRPGTANENGTGFGLPIAHVYIEQFNGTVTVQSRTENSAGTVFEIRFPLCAPIAHHARASA